MKKRIILLCFGILVSIATFAPANKALIIPIEPPITPYEILWQAVCMVESSGNPNAYNIKEKATGIAQIRPIRLKDFARQTGIKYTLNEMYDPCKSKKVFLFFADKHHHLDLQTIARRWNGSGKKTEVYWEKVRKEIINLENRNN